MRIESMNMNVTDNFLKDIDPYLDIDVERSIMVITEPKDKGGTDVHKFDPNNFDTWTYSMK